MTCITQIRMRNQRLTDPLPSTPQEAVQQLGAIQAQDFGPAKWSVAQRSEHVTNATVDEALAAGTILRTHVLRPTWHFVLPADIRWMLELTAPRVRTSNASTYRNQDLNNSVLDRCNSSVAGALRGGLHLTRQEIAGVLERAGIATNSLRLGAILMNAELNGIICSGVPREKQQTYALLEERVTRAKRLSHEEALAELTLRYFTGHGPATAKDLRWWSSLPLADINSGLAMVASCLEHEKIAGVTYWFATRESTREPPSPTVRLVQGYDEYIVGYGESKFLIDLSGVARSLPRPRGIYTHSVILDGQVVGQWKPVARKKALVVEASLFTPFTDAETQALGDEVQRYGEFVGRPAALTVR